MLQKKCGKSSRSSTNFGNFSGVAPEPVEDTPEVAAAKAEFAAKFEEVASRSKRESDPALVYGYNNAYLLNARFRYGFGAKIQKFIC